MTWRELALAAQTLRRYEATLVADPYDWDAHLQIAILRARIEHAWRKS